MPNLSAKEAGDNFYPQYNRITTEPVDDIVIEKGKLYTKDAEGRLIVPTSGFLNGVYQATRSIPVKGTAGQHSVQCFGPGSRVGLPAKIIKMFGGMKVKYDSGKVDKLTLTSSVRSSEYLSDIGRIFEIYSKIDIAKKKRITAVDDIVIVELGQG